MNNDSLDNIFTMAHPRLSKSIENQCIESKETQRWSTLNNSDVICISSDDESDSDVEIVDAQKVDKDNARAAVKVNESVTCNATDCFERLLVKCRSTGRWLESWNALQYDGPDFREHVNSLLAGPIRFQCPVLPCMKIFSNKGNLKQHINGIHTKKNDFRCTKCSYKSFYKQHLGRHLTKVHGERTMVHRKKFQFGNECLLQTETQQQPNRMEINVSQDHQT